MILLPEKAMKCSRREFLTISYDALDLEYWYKLIMQIILDVVTWHN